MRRTTFALCAMLAMALVGCSMTPRRVAIMDFENATGNPDCDKLKTAIPEYLTQYLSADPSVCLLERQDIHRFLGEIDADPGSDSLSRWQKLGQKINAEYIVAGSCSRLDRNFIVTARLFSVEKGQVISGSASTKTCLHEYEIFDRAKNIAAELTYQLKTRFRSQPLEPAAAAEAPSVRPLPEGDYGSASEPAAYERAPLPDLDNRR